MISLTFRVTSSAEPRDIVVGLHEPTRSPPDAKWPWDIVVEVEGRSYTTYGMDPLDAIENGCQHAARLLRGVYDDTLDPPIEPRD
jgi:hypothetical protein